MVSPAAWSSNRAHEPTQVSAEFRSIPPFSGEPAEQVGELQLAWHTPAAGECHVTRGSVGGDMGACWVHHETCLRCACWLAVREGLVLRV